MSLVSAFAIASLLAGLGFFTLVLAWNQDQAAQRAALVARSRLAGGSGPRITIVRRW